MPPELQVAAGAKAATALQFLRDQLPPYALAPSVMSPSKKINASRPAQLDFGRAWSTVVDPGSAIADLKAGRMTPIQALAMKTVYPKMYQDLQMATLQGIAQADASGNRVPIHVRQQLDLLLGLGGGGEPAFGERISSMVQQGLAQQEQQQQQQRHKAPQLSKSMTSPTEEMLGVKS
jgi:hypothetical protein